MHFEFDPTKRSRNKEKHGIDFVEAQGLWLDDNLVEIPARTDGEDRFLVVAQLDRKVWAAIVTYRGGSIRLISVRRARTEEEGLCED
jgi:uncharacterized DUF497 family protein